MKKTIIRLDRGALRSLIKEAMQGRQPGSPLFTPTRSRIKESDTFGGMALTAADDVSYAASDMARRYFGSMYDPNDPSMEAAGGKDAWDEQVEGAVYELESQLQQLVETIEKKLIDGQYHKWNG